MSVDDLVVASTTDSAEQMQAALMHGTETATPPAKVEEPPAVEEKPPVEEKPAPVATKEKEPEAAKEPTKTRPRREDFTSEDDWADALMGHRAKKRIDTLTYEREEARRKSEALEARIAKLETPTGDTPPAAAPGPEPQAGDFETHEEWIAALVAHKTAVGVDAALAKEREKVNKAEEGLQREEEFQKFLAQRTDARGRYEDFDEVIKDNGDMALSGVMNYVIMSSEVGNDISYYLATHRDKAAEIAAMTGPDAIRAMGKVEHTVENIVASKIGRAKADAEGDPPPAVAAKVVETPAVAAVPAKSKVSQAAEPIEPIGSRSARSTVPDDELPYDQYKAKRDRDELARKKYRR